MEEMISAPCSFRAAFPSEHPLKNESMKQCIRREKANPRSTKVPSSYGFVLRQSPRPRHLPEGNKISERNFFGFVEKPTPLRASRHNSFIPMSPIAGWAHILPNGDVGVGGPLRHSCEALDSRRARQPLVDAKGYSRINTHKPLRCRGRCFGYWRL